MKLIFALALVLCIGLTMGCGAPAPAVNHPLLLGTWVGTLTGISDIPNPPGGSEPTVTEPLTITVTNSDAGTVADIQTGDAQVYADTCIVGTNTALPTASATVSAAIWSSTTRFTMTAPTINGSSATVYGIYDPSAPNTFTGSMNGVGWTPDVPCNINGSFSVTLQP